MYILYMFEECLYFNTVKFTRMINSFWEEAYRPTGLSPSHAYLLQFILEQPGATPKKLAEKMDLKLSTVSRFVDSLTAKGLVERKKENRDKRECSVYPTKPGINLKDELESISNNLHRKIRKILGETNVTEAVSLLGKLSADLNNEKVRK